jgi:beta-lactam-binding protein with PASTA domain
MPSAPLNTNPRWTADGFNQWTADGFYGWTADGYEPTTLAAAVAAFALAGVNVGLLTYAFSSTVPIGYVITGWPPLLASAPPGTYVPLTISEGPAPPVVTALVPNVVGKFYSDAQLALNNARLLIAPPIWVISSIVLPQYVISQSIAAGSIVPEQTQVTITVSGFTVIMQPSNPMAVP